MIESLIIFISSNFELQSKPLPLPCFLSLWLRLLSLSFTFTRLQPALGSGGTGTSSHQVLSVKLLSRDISDFTCQGLDFTSSIVLDVARNGKHLAAMRDFQRSSSMKLRRCSNLQKMAFALYGCVKGQQISVCQLSTYSQLRNRSLPIAQTTKGSVRLWTSQWIWAPPPDECTSLTPQQRPKSCPNGAILSDEEDGIQARPSQCDLQARLQALLSRWR
eukprot:2895529-Amphidinium_carterae.1